MIYREFRGEKLSALGFGSMRMPVVDGDYGKVDYKAAEEMVDCAMRGGKLCSLSAEDEAKLKALRPQESVTGWGFRFVQSVPEVVVTLSGMSTLAQVQENIKTFETDAPLGAGELAALFAHCAGDDGEGVPSLHGVPLLHEPLPEKAGYSRAHQTVQRASLYGRRVHRADGGEHSARGKAPLGVHRVRELRKGMSAADRYSRHDEGLCRAACKERMMRLQSIQARLHKANNKEA